MGVPPAPKCQCGWGMLCVLLNKTAYNLHTAAYKSVVCRGTPAHSCTCSGHLLLHMHVWLRPKHSTGLWPGTLQWNMFDGCSCAHQHVFVHGIGAHLLQGVLTYRFPTSGVPSLAACFSVYIRPFGSGRCLSANVMNSSQPLCNSAWLSPACLPATCFGWDCRSCGARPGHKAAGADGQVAALLQDDWRRASGAHGGRNPASW